MTSDLLFGTGKINWTERINSLYPTRNRRAKILDVLNEKSKYVKRLRRGGNWTGKAEVDWSE